MRLSVMAMMLSSVLPNACCTALLTWVIIDDSIFSRAASTSPDGTRHSVCRFVDHPNNRDIDAYDFSILHL